VRGRYVETRLSKGSNILVRSKIKCDEERPQRRCFNMYLFAFLFETWGIAYITFKIKCDGKMTPTPLFQYLFICFSF
jgi:hypothetical protein